MLLRQVVSMLMTILRKEDRLAHSLRSVGR